MIPLKRTIYSKGGILIEKMFGLETMFAYFLPLI